MDLCAAGSTIVNHWREHPPSSYSLKINNLSQFKPPKYESRYFASGGYNWRMVIYPEGNVKENGSEFLSMYVEIDSTSISSASSTEVFAYFIFFIYNKKENKYFTIQDVEVKRFNALRTVWGLSQVLSLETFNDPENGYIFEGEQCEFGVDVMVVSPFTKWEVVSFKDEFYYPKFSWSIKDFSVLKEYFYKSNTFSKGGRKWALDVYPKGDSRAEGKWLSIFLNLAHSEVLTVNEKIYVRANMQVLDPRGSNHFKVTLDYSFTESKKTRGFPRYLSLAKLRDTYLDLEDTLNVEIEFEVVSATKFSPVT